MGLLTNSPALIIGAMIIAPLMGPIIASALAIDAGDIRELFEVMGRMKVIRSRITDR